MEVIEEKILIVADEENLCEILQYNLSNEGYIAEIARSSEEALKRPLHNYNLLLIDVMIGPMSGFKFAHKLRNQLNNNVPIIFLSAKDTEYDILTGFNLGADDYITKPFSVNELVARVKAVLKRLRTIRLKTYELIKFGEIKLDYIHRRLVINDERIELPKKEYEILKLLLENQTKVFSREELLTIIWGNNVTVMARSIDVNIARLRIKLGKLGQNLKNKTGCGYYFEF